MKLKFHMSCLRPHRQDQIRNKFFISRFFLTFFALLLLNFSTSFAQDCNTLTSINLPTYSVTVSKSTTPFTGPSISNESNVISASITDYATISGGILGNGYINVKNNNTVYPAQTFAGFEIRSDAGLLGLNLLSSLTIQLLNNAGTIVETRDGNSTLAGISLLETGNNTNILGFTSSVPFSQVRIVYQAGIISLGTLRVYGAVIKKMCENTAPIACNSNVALANPDFPVNIDMERTGVFGLVNALGSVDNPEYVIDDNPLNYASISGVSVGAISKLTVKKELSVLAADSNFIGFDIGTNGLANLGLLNGLEISVLHNGSVVQTVTSSQLLSLNSSLLSGSNRNTIGFLPSVPFDAIQLSVNSTLSLNLGELRIYGVVLKRLCEGAPLICNSPTAVQNPDYPVFVNVARMNESGLVAIGSVVNNSENIIDADPNNFATVQLTAGVGNKASVSVKDALSYYPAGTFTGFDIQNNQSLLSADLLGGITIQTYKDDTLQETMTGSALLIGATTSLLSPVNRSKVGFMTTKSFDEVVITLENTLVTANLGTTEIYGAIFESFCPGVISCNNTFWLTNPDFPVIINQKHTGANGLLAVGAVSNADHVISQTNSDYATIDLNVGALSAASLSVQDVLSTYPAGTIAGFAIQDPGYLLEAALFQNLAINTYKNGTLQESKSASSLLNLSVLLNFINPGPGVHNVGFYTTKEFDEVQIMYSGAASVLKTLYIYGAFVDTRFVNSGSLICGIGSNPDSAIVGINTLLNGDVSVNDTTPPNTWYSYSGVSDIPIGANPVFTIDSNGVYTFIGDVPGIYTYHISICTEAIVAPCPTETLTITVTNPLPLELRSFSVENLDCNALLHWTTTNEKNISHFILEAGNDARELKEIGKVISTLNQDQEKEYNFEYKMNPNSNYFFRLKMVDLDNTFRYSTVQKAYCTASGKLEVTVSPNPTTSVIQLSGLNNENCQITISDISGRSLLSRKVSKQTSLSLDLEKFPIGLYYMKIQTESGEIQNLKISKQ